MSDTISEEPDLSSSPSFLVNAVSGVTGSIGGMTGAVGTAVLSGVSHVSQEVGGVVSSVTAGMKLSKSL